MATHKHKPKKARKGKGRKSSRRGKKKGLSGVSPAPKMSTSGALKETGKTTGGLLLGLLTSAVAGYGLDKIGPIQAKDTDGKVVSFFKKAIKPVVLIGLGVTGSIVGRKKGIKFLSSFGDGFAVGGAFSGFKAIVGTKTNMFSGLGSSEDVLSKVANYYQENMEELKKNMIESGAVVKLGEAENNMSGNQEEMNGGRRPGSEMRVEESTTFI